MERIFIKNFPISIGKYSSIMDEILKKAQEKKSAVVCVANVHMFIETQKDPEFLKIINGADIVTADGQPLIFCLKMLKNIKQERIAGMDLLPDLLHQMALNNISAFFYGGTEMMLDKTKKFVEKNYSNLKIAGLHSPSFSNENTSIDTHLLNQINNSFPCIVFVVLGCPKQEKWMAAMRGKVNTVMIGIGGALPVMVGIQKRAPEWMQKYGLEWIFRLYLEPRRLFYRYLKTNSLFLWIFFKELIILKIFQPFFQKKRK